MDSQMGKVAYLPPEESFKLERENETISTRNKCLRDLK